MQPASTYKYNGLRAQSLPAVLWAVHRLSDALNNRIKPRHRCEPVQSRNPQQTSWSNTPDRQTESVCSQRERRRRRGRMKTTSLLSTISWHPSVTVTYGHVRLQVYRWKYSKKKPVMQRCSFRASISSNNRLRKKHLPSKYTHELTDAIITACTTNTPYSVNPEVPWWNTVAHFIQLLRAHFNSTVIVIIYYPINLSGTLCYNEIIFHFYQYPTCQLNVSYMPWNVGYPEWKHFCFASS